MGGLEEFRVDAAAWLATKLTRRADTEPQWGLGSDSVAVFRDLTPEAEARLDANVREWHRVKLAVGWAGFSWPERYGGQALPAIYDQVFAEEESHFDAPPEHEAFSVTVHLVAPTIDRFGTAEQQNTYVERFLRAEALCCQLFSEPEAGSDLASLRCVAAPTEAGWRVRGEKVWTSGAHLCDYGLLLARSDPDAAQHHGITAFLLPLDRDGIEVRPIRQMTGGAAFNQVFLDDVFVPDSLRIGAPGEGWRVALTTLAFERGSSGDGAGGVGGSPQQALTLARHLGADAVARQDAAQLYALGRIGELSAQRERGALVGGDEPGPVGSLGKLFWTQRLTHTSATVSRLLGPALAADTGAWGTYAWREHVLGAPGYRIAGGSDEIQRNIIGERVLGLPREPRP